MKTYELLAILKPNLDQEEVDKFTEKLETTVKNLGGKTIELEKAGRKDLAATLLPGFHKNRKHL